MASAREVNTYEVGDLVELRIDITQQNKVPIDPSTTRLLHKDPTSNVTVLEYSVDTDLLKVSTGIFYYNLPIDEAGTWHYRWELTGAVIGAAQWMFIANAATVST